MPIIEKTIRFAAIALAVLFVGLSLFGIFGAWGFCFTRRFD